MTIIDTITKFFLANQVVLGLGAASIFGWALFVLRRLPEAASGFARTVFTTSVTLDSDRDLYWSVERWLAATATSRTTRSLRVVHNFSDGTFSLAPGFGNHLLWVRGAPVWVHKERLETKDTRSNKTEAITLTTLGRSHAPLRELLIAARKFDEAGDGRVHVHVWCNGWRRIAERTKRPADSLTLSHTPFEAIIGDMTKFDAAKDWYAERGIPYRRGYLFEGPAGTGKTSAIFVAAGALGRTVYVLSPSSFQNDEMLLEALIEIERDAIVAIEDIDCVGAPVARETSPSSASAAAKGVTLSGILNALDGLVTPEGQIVVMTTNRADVLDAALLRPGRVDVRLHFGHLDSEGQRAMFRKFYGEAAFWTTRAAISPAEIQVAFMANPGDPKAALQALMKCEEPAMVGDRIRAA